MSEKYTICDLPAACDGADRHVVSLVTDGRKYYTYGKGDAGYTTAMLAIDDRRVDGVCPSPQCDGHLDWELPATGSGLWFQIQKDHPTVDALTYEYDWADMPDLTDTDQLEEWLRE